MPLGETLFEPIRCPEYVYFPTNAVVSLLSQVKDDAIAEIALVGKEGVVGISQLLVGDISPSRAVVLSAGYGYRLKHQAMQAEYNKGGSVLRLMLRYATALTIQMTVTTGCHRQHSVEQKLCRLMLLSLDRLLKNELSMTHDLMANLIGVHRDVVAEAAVNLQNAGLITYRRGHIGVHDRVRMGRAVCECYGMVKEEVDRLVAGIPCTHSFPHPHADMAINT